MDTAREMTHAFDCTQFCGKYLNIRHNLCREAFISVLKDINDYTPTIEMEVAVGLNHQRRADVVLHETEASDPAAPRYRTAAEPSHISAGAAGKFRAEEKRTQYRNIGVRVFPAVVETT